VFLPIGAIIFRMGGVTPGENIVRLNLPESEVLSALVEFGDEVRLHANNMEPIWEKLGAPAALTLLRPMEIVVGASELTLSEEIAEPAGTWVSETSELEWDNLDSAKAVFTINSQAVKSAIGYIGGETIDLSDVIIEMEETPSNWAAIAMASLDGEAISSSAKILLVAAGGAENTGMQWNEDRTTVGANWGDSPVKVEGIPASITIRSNGGLKVSTLDPVGNVIANVPAEFTDDTFSFTIGAEHKTLWYLITR
jgi:hypothetical protein